MSDVTFHHALTAPLGSPVAALLRAGVRRLRHAAAQVAETVHTYSLIEAACLLAAMAFCSVFAAAAFGLPL
jgi:hypothetical protein